MGTNSTDVWARDRAASRNSAGRIIEIFLILYVYVMVIDRKKYQKFNGSFCLTNVKQMQMRSFGKKE